jgi:DNA helicase-2/ATP-dependent DNA helicase PcrA
MATGAQFEEAYARLNPEQKKAVDTIDGPVMVIAGPGTGKTQVLALRVGNILKHTDIAPGNILCLTFTDAAAVNMRERLSVLIGSAGYKVAVHTFHGFAREVIASYPEHFYNGADFIAADDLTQLEILERVFAELPRTDPLSVLHEGEYTYLKDAKRAIGLLKQAGLTPEEFTDLIEQNTHDLPAISKGLSSVFADRLSQKSIGEAALLAKTLAETVPEKPIEGTLSLAHAVAASLARAVRIAEETEKAAPLSSWKEKWAKKDNEGNRVLKDALYIEKMRTLALVYRRYRESMYAQKYYDFDDMLLDVVHALIETPSLLSSLEERYQYILVDEFQDTNDAQLRLIRLMGSAPVNEGLPNIMIVGDDDQAIYRFQGAEISNILDFPKHFRGHALVVLTKNYRSTQQILDVAREVIEKSEERLEKVLPTLEKKLVSSRPELGDGHIVHALLPTRTHEHAYIAREVKRLIAEGAEPSEIAIIARRHRELEDIARVMVAAGIPITYERKQNVFEEPHIRMLITMAHFVASLVRSGKDEADHYLPEILSAPFFGIPRETIWEISVVAARRSDRTWLGAMRDHEDKRVNAIAKWFIELGARSHHEPLERVLDELIGTEGVLLPVEAVYEHEESITPLPDTGVIRSFKSPFREYYFGDESRRQNESQYLLFLSSLRVFVGAIRDYKKGTQLSLDDLVEFTALHERNGILLSDTTPFASSTSAVNLMTAHKSKGLEFDTVFVVSCQEEVWAGRGFPNKLPFPMNLPIERDEGGDDRLRIFYVALTRAKRHLYVTAYEKDDAGKSSLKVSFIAPEREGGSIATHLAGTTALLSANDLVGGIASGPTHPSFYPIVPGERAILRELVKDYHMSVTHLNNFLDVTKGGPALFLEQNLLRFPQAMSPSSAYGSAMHKAIELFYRDFKKSGRVPRAESLLEQFDFALTRERMTESEFLHFLDAGKKALTIWWTKKGKHIDATHRSEVDFKAQGVVVGATPLSGKIDKMIEEGDEMLVYDFKTGKAKPDWEGKDAREKVTLANYKRQLIFYKLLVEHSHDFSRFQVKKGVLEFLEPVKDDIAELAFTISDEDTKRLTQLVNIVHKKILALDFPDTSGYAQDLSGITQFEADLLGGDV